MTDSLSNFTLCEVLSPVIWLLKSTDCEESKGTPHVIKLKLEADVPLKIRPKIGMSISLAITPQRLNSSTPQQLNTSTAQPRKQTVFARLSQLSFGNWVLPGRERSFVAPSVGESAYMGAKMIKDGYRLFLIMYERIIFNSRSNRIFSLCILKDLTGSEDSEDGAATASFVCLKTLQKHLRQGDLLILPYETPSVSSGLNLFSKELLELNLSTPQPLTPLYQPPSSSLSLSFSLSPSIESQIHTQLLAEGFFPLTSFAFTDSSTTLIPALFSILGLKFPYLSQCSLSSTKSLVFHLQKTSKLPPYKPSPLASPPDKTFFLRGRITGISPGTMAEIVGDPSPTKHPSLLQQDHLLSFSYISFIVKISIVTSEGSPLELLCNSAELSNRRLFVRAGLPKTTKTDVWISEKSTLFFKGDSLIREVLDEPEDRLFAVYTDKNEGECTVNLINFVL